MGPQNQFEKDAYDLVTAERVHIADHQLGRTRQGALDVWVESSEKGKRFLRQITVGGNLYAARNEPYTKACYILRDRRTGRYWFLDENVCGFWLQDESFFGARTFTGAESSKITGWLAQEGGQKCLMPANDNRTISGKE